MRVLAQASWISWTCAIRRRHSRGPEQSKGCARLVATHNHIANPEFSWISWILPHFIEGLSKIAKPMTELLKKDKKYEWTEDCEKSFNKLKIWLTTAPVLTLPNIYRSFDVYSDASRQGLGCILMQDDKVVAYASQQL